MPVREPSSLAARWRTPILAAFAVAAAAAVGWFIWSAWRSSDLLAQARAAAARSDWDRTGELLERYRWYEPNDLEALQFQVRATLERRDPTAAARMLAGVPSSAPGAVEARLSQGRLLMEAFLPREAEAALRDCLRIDPGTDAARLTLLAILGVQRRGREYEAEAWALFERGGQRLKALRLLAQAAPAIPPDTFTRTADLGDVLRRCLAADPDDPHTRLALANFERKRGAIDEALRLLEPVLRANPADPDAALERAACLLDDGEVDRLRPFFEEPADSLRTLGAFWLLRAEWARRQGLESEEIANCREAIRLDPRSPEAHYRLGLALHETGPEAKRSMDVARKARELKDFVAQIPDRSYTPDQLVRAGKLCAEMGRDREARAWFSLALRTDPDHAGARAELATLDAARAPRRAEAKDADAR